MTRRGSKSNRGDNLEMVRGNPRSNQELPRAQDPSNDGRATLPPRPSLGQESPRARGARIQAEVRQLRVEHGSRPWAQEPLRAQVPSNNDRATLPPRPPKDHETSRRNRASQSTTLPSTVPTQHPLPANPRSSQESDRSSRPLPSGPEHLQSDYDVRALAKLPMRPVQPPDDVWFAPEPRKIANRGRYPQHQTTEYSQARPHEAYRQRTPPPNRHQSEYPPWHQPHYTIPHDSRHILAYRPVREVLGVRSRSRSPPAEKPHRSTNRVEESRPRHIGDALRATKKCGNCKREGHEVKDCVSKIGRSGFVMACPRCNSNRHLYDRCPSSNVSAPGTREREEDDLYYLVTCRQNKPQIFHRVGLNVLLQWATPSLAAFPWSANFALRYHEDPQQAAAERDYDYSKHDFGLAGSRPDREALTRKFDPSHPVIPKIPMPTTLSAPPSVTRDARDLFQRMVPCIDTPEVDDASNYADSRGKATRARSGIDSNGSAAKTTGKRKINLAVLFDNHDTETS